MKIDQLYLTHINPYLKRFKLCKIYNYELLKLNQKVAESINQKDIYRALDIPDFKYVKEVRIQSDIIELACTRLKIGEESKVSNHKGIQILDIDRDKYQIIFFPSGSVPEVNLKKEKLIFFMYQPNFEKIYYCGKLELNDILDDTISNFYKNNCYKNTNKFIDFKSLYF